MKRDTMEVNGTTYPVKIQSEKRSNSTVSIGKKGISIRIPLSLNREEMFREIIKLRQWARKKLEESPQKFRPASTRTYKDGDILKAGDEEYTLRIDFKEKQSSSAGIRGNEIRLSISSNLPKETQDRHISTLLSRCIAAKRIPRLREKISQLCNAHFSQFNKPVNRIFFKHNKSNWGSCSEAGNINISTRLLFAPEDVLEYVCIHELSHLIEPNHSERFWSLVGKAMPAYNEKIKWLKENGDTCRF